MPNAKDPFFAHYSITDSAGTGGYYYRGNGRSVRAVAE